MNEKILILGGAIAFLGAFGNVIYTGRTMKSAGDKRAYACAVLHHEDALKLLPWYAGLLLVVVLIIVRGKTNYHAPLFWVHESFNLLLVTTTTLLAVFNGKRKPAVHRRLMPLLCGGIVGSATTGGILLWQL